MGATDSIGWRARLRRFVVPERRWRYWLRVAAVGLGAWLFFGFICRPAWVHGASMEPTYRDGRLIFCWRQRYRWRAPRPGDGVMVRLAGERVMLLKRVVAVAGDTVEFRGGVLYVNDAARSEPYVRGPCTWELPPRQVEAGELYVVGDHRAMPLEEHKLGRVAASRVAGGPWW